MGLIILSPLLALSCASANMELVAKAAAYDNYYTASYEHKCRPNPTEEPCKSCKATINDGEWKVRVANTNLVVGVLPPQEVKELEQLILDLQRCP